MAITSYAYHYLDISNINPIEFRSKMIDLHEDNMSWKAVLLVLEFCYCAPILNATLKRHFIHMNLVKTTVWNRLSNEFKLTSVEYQCTPFTMSMLISAFNTGITQKIIVYRKKTIKLTKKDKEKQKDYIFTLFTFLHLQAIMTLQRRVNKLIFCTPCLTIGCEN